MYNGIGVPTPRGTGTSGFVVVSRTAVTVAPLNVPVEKKMIYNKSESLKEYNHLREIESKCYSLKKKLEKQGLAKEDIEKAVNDLREGLKNPQPRPSRKKPIPKYILDRVKLPDEEEHKVDYSPTTEQSIDNQQSSIRTSSTIPAPPKIHFSNPPQVLPDNYNNSSNEGANNASNDYSNNASNDYSNNASNGYSNSASNDEDSQTYEYSN